MTDRVVKLTIVNDFVCANCCIGQHELLSAISYCKDTLRLPLSFELEHMPFRLISTACLSDDSTKAKVAKSTFYENRYGKEKFTNIEAAISKWAKEKGIPISLRGVMSQSTRAHRLAIKAGKIGGQKYQLPVLCGIFKANLEDNKDIADINVLAEIAESTGMMSKDEAIQFLHSDELEQEVNDMCENARNIGISGVPMTIIDGKWAISGGQSSDVYVQVFKKLAAAGVSPNGVYAAPSPLPASVVETNICA
ncbi:putative DSBA-like thioredoxin domain containing protein [Lyophyllum shimeji]|uniref:DSBA-like thioredoxin domain containing protein n=1 Tax=Lyophyllum shimeji TaxID=47721 RepID=A0A9P3PRT9_LYOSH|nr:putative DSBA-like thioredoxin domain containing protein [Lyophyllum shimeji]